MGIEVICECDENGCTKKESFTLGDYIMGTPESKGWLINDTTDGELAFCPDHGAGHEKKSKLLPKTPILMRESILGI